MKVEIVDKDVRFYNYIVDVLAILFITLFLSVFANYFVYIYSPIILLLFQAVYFVYYFAMEYSCHKTLGKMVTKTIVIHKSGGEPTLTNYLVRTILRIATLDVISFLLGTKIGMHDMFSNTRVVKIH